MKNKKILGIPIVIIVASIPYCVLCCFAALFYYPGGIINNITLFVQAPPFSEAWRVRESSKVFLDNVQNYKSEIAYESLTDEYKKIIGSPEQLRLFLHYPIKSYDLPFSKIDDNNKSICTVAGVIIDDNGIRYSIMIEYQKSGDGIWKIDKMTIEKVKGK